MSSPGPAPRSPGATTSTRRARARGAADAAASAANTARDGADRAVSPGGRKKPQRDSSSAGLTPAQRKAKRDANLLAKKVRAATRLQAAVRGKRARRLEAEKRKAPITVNDLRSNIEPYITTAIATTIAVQWDDAVQRTIRNDPNSEWWVFLSAVGTTIYASILYAVLACVSERFNKRLLNLIKQSLQILVGWQWKGIVAEIDKNIDTNDSAPGKDDLTHLSSQEQLWARFGIMLCIALLLGPLFTFTTTLFIHPTRMGTRGNPCLNFVANFGALLLGASALVIGFSWHLALQHFTQAAAYDSVATPDPNDEDDPFAIQDRQERRRVLSLLLLIAIFRAVGISALAAWFRTLKPLANASKVAKPPKKDDTVVTSFVDRSRFVGNKSLIFVSAFAWWSIVEALANVATGDVCDAKSICWGEYIVWTVFIGWYIGFAIFLAVRRGGSSRPVCVDKILCLANAELLYFATVAIQLGWAVKNSYQTLIENLAEESGSTIDIIYWTIGGTLMLIFWLLVFFTAIFGRVQRTPEEDERTKQL